MPSERWRRVEQLFGDAVVLPPDQRAAFLASAAVPDGGIRDDVAALLSADDRSGPFLSSTALDVFAGQIAREGWTVQPGDRIGSYRIDRRLGAGGMGEVWRAHDERLGRDVAIKLLLPHPARDAGRLAALQDEARAAGALNHTNVLTVHDVGEHHGASYLVTECLEGQSLRARLSRGPLPVDAALDIAVQVARGLTAAQAGGIVHGDLKPENVFLGTDGRVKILDFGLARMHDSPWPAGGPVAVGQPPRAVTGTVGYMAPEQLRGERSDGRADVFALGVVLHEMLVGARPFTAESGPATAAAILTRPPVPVDDIDHGIPRAVSALVLRCLEKAAADRFATAADVVAALEAVIRSRQPPAAASLLALVRRPAVSVALLVALAATVAGAWYWRLTADRAHWARTIAPPEAQRLFEHGDYAEAFFLARQALALAPDDAALQRLWRDVSVAQPLHTEPAGVEVAIAAYRDRTPAWLAVGRTPLTGVPLPRGQFRLRLSKPGFETIEVASELPHHRYRLDAAGTVPPGMVRVAGGTLDDFWMDRLEVTNRQFQLFVDQGGYLRPELWREPFVEGGRRLPWAEGVDRFRDRSRTPGPSTWTGGRYPDGQADLPVGGVSWHEASAYAAFAGKSLPTMHHWYRAAALGRFADILGVSNFNGQGPAAVGRSNGLGPFGTLDMAGNVKEWCSTAAGESRVVLGGAWNEPRYVFAHADPRSPFERAATFGIRLVRYLRPLPAAVTGPVRLEELVRDGRALRPVGDDVFAAIRQQYAYDRTPLRPVVEATEVTAAWTRITVSIDGAGGKGRLRAHLFLPTEAVPPYQAIVFFPAADAFQLRAGRDLSLRQVAFVVRSGRALLYPIYDGTYERATGQPLAANARREQRIAWSRELGRGLDYLESRPDIDRARLGFYGISAGADAGTILTALEPRLTVNVLQGTGIWGDETPEHRAIDYAPRIRVPTMLLNGRYDFGVPLDTAQRPLFDALGTPPDQKRHVILEAGHALSIEDAADAVLPWLDRHLGPVRLRQRPPP
jgi:formylglycine-generating enzyme required for sulfatase activity/dienelactone hydrolase